MRSCNVIRIAWALGVLSAPLVQAAPVPVCTQREIDSLNSYYLRGFQMALNAQALEVDAVIAFTAEGEALTQQLSRDCRSGLERVGNAVQERARATGRPIRLSGVLYDAGSDAYIVPGSVSCGPSACTPLQ